MVNPRRVRLIAESTLKTDAIDAEILARLAGLDPALLQPVYQRRPEAEAMRTRLGVRRTLRRSRVAMINSVRGTLRASGYRMVSASADRFVARFYELRLPVELEETLEPLLEMIARLSDRIATVEAEVKALARKDELLRRLQSVPGVGPVVSAAFQAWIDDPYRFSHSRDVGAYLGARPKLRESSEWTRGRCHPSFIAQDGIRRLSSRSSRGYDHVACVFEEVEGVGLVEVEDRSRVGDDEPQPALPFCAKAHAMSSRWYCS